MKTVAAFDNLYMSMLPVTGRTLVFNNEFMLDDNFGLPPNHEDIEAFVKAGRPFKINFTMMLLCTEGVMRVRVNLRDFRLEKNVVLVVLPGSIGECLEFGDDCRLAVIAYSGNSYGDAADPAFSIPIMKYLSADSLIRVSAEEMGVALVLYKAMRMTFERNGFRFKREALGGYMQVLFCYGYQWMCDYEDSGAGGKPAGRRQQLFERFLHLVQRHYAGQRSVSFYAGKMCVTPKYLSETVKTVSRRTPNEWIDNYVTMELRAQLRNTTKSIKEIAREMNFPNQSFLGKYFKEHVGMSPMSYRKS